MIMRVGSSISDDELMALYERADYNFCFGSTDQLTLSIPYALLKGAVNILSPLPNYYDLHAKGYSSVQIVPEVSTNALVRYLRESLVTDQTAVQIDAQRAAGDFVMTETFRRYVDLYQKILRRQS